MSQDETINGTIPIPESMAEYLRELQAQINSLKSQPAVLQYSDLLVKRNHFLESLIAICKIDQSEGPWSLDMESGQFVRNENGMDAQDSVDLVQ